MSKIKKEIKNLKVIFNTYAPPHIDGLRVIGIWPNESVLKEGEYLTGSMGSGWFLDDYYKVGQYKEDPILWADVSQIYDAIEDI
jgi:hypothetical protein